MEMPTSSELVAWLVVGALSGSLVGMLVKRKKEGFGHLTNLGVGLVGALIGGFLFKVLHIDLGDLKEIQINLQQMVAAFLGSLLFLGVVWFVRRRRAKSRGMET
jgi:uncharacterized membrane protein YeaQ/YmgE (transglycosylase-associated protein family)